ncbi:MAG: sugar-binding domain-containing protein, partial [Bryobacteraceae bacterium]
MTKLSWLLWFPAVTSFAAPPAKTLLSECLRGGGPSYECSFQAPADAADKHVRVVLDGSMSQVAILLNGELLGERHSGVTPFELDLTPALKTGATNQLAVRLDKTGSLRSLYLLTTGRVYPVSQTISASPQRIAVSVMVRNTLDNTAGVQASFEISINGKAVASGSVNAAVPPNLTQPMEALIPLRPEDVKLWDPDHPNLYRIRTVVAKNAEAVEGAYETEIESPFGIRTVEIQGSHFLLNGEPLRLGGAHPAGEPAEAELQSMKEAGMVFQMLDHPVSTSMLEWADRNGLLL